MTTTCSDNRAALRRSIALEKLNATLSKACTMRLLLMQGVKMLIDEVMMDSFGQTFIQLINIRHYTMYLI